MGRSPCCSKVGLRRGPWSTKEDTLLSNYIQLNGEGQWRSLPKKAGLLRCGKSCRLRWMNYLRPGIKRGNINQDEEDLIVRMHGLLGNRWSLIAGRLPGRTDNEIKNYWNTHLLKKLQTAGIQPRSHKELPKKPPKNTKITDKPTTTTGPAKKKKHQKTKADAPAREEEQSNDVIKTKVYLPKPIRVSSAFSRTDSYDSLASGSSSSEGGAAAAAGDAAEKEAWPPLFEDDFLGMGYPILPLLQQQPSDSFSGEVDMLMEQVYDEYLQLL